MGWLDFLPWAGKKDGESKTFRQLKRLQNELQVQVHQNIYQTIQKITSNFLKSWNGAFLHLVISKPTVGNRWKLPNTSLSKVPVTGWNARNIYLWKDGYPAKLRAAVNKCVCVCTFLGKKYSALMVVNLTFFHSLKMNWINRHIWWSTRQRFYSMFEGKCKNILVLIRPWYHFHWVLSNRTFSMIAILDFIQRVIKSHFS